MIWWTYQQLRNRNPKSRLAAIEKLAAAGDRESVQPLMFALKDEKAEVRSAAAMALGKLGDREVVNGLVGLLRDADAGVRSSAARSLGKLGWQPADDAERMSLLVATGKMPQVSEFG
ncbi:MAG: HEAT repeat domain-containing protein, partial [Verrucomicrobiota bacterium]